MAKQNINIGSSANDRSGDSLRSGASKINQNFNEIYSTFGDGTSLIQGSIQGVQGTTGSQGSIGIQGTVGSQGIQGTIGQGVQGIQGPAGSGEGGGSQGVQGIQGPAGSGEGGGSQGVQGIQGVQGPSGSGGGGESYWQQTAAGIHTLSNVGIGTTNPTSALTVSGSLNVSGISTLSSNVSIGGTVSVDGGVKLVTNNATIVGTSGTVGEIKRIGGAPFFYDGSAWREFVLSSGTPVSVPADTEWDNVILRNTFDTNFDDAKFGVSPVYVGGGSTIVSSPLKIGTKSFRNDGTAGAGISFAYRSEYDFTGPWTIEFWIYHDASIGVGEYISLISMTNASNTSGEWTFGLTSNGTNTWWYWDNENNVSAKTLQVVANTTFNSTYLNKWVHYALVREADDGSIHFYINGVESSSTASDDVIDNNILNINGSGLHIGGISSPTINSATWNGSYSIDAFIDDLRISTVARYTSVGITTTTTFTPPTTALPTTGTLSSYVQPPGDKYGEITLGGSPTWRGTSGVTVSQQSSGNYRVSFASTYTNSNDYYVLSQGMDQGFASYVGIARSTTHVDLSVNRQSNDAAVDTGSLAVQIKNHI